MTTLFIDGGGFCSFWYCLGAISTISKQFEYVEGISSGSIVATLIVCMDKLDILQILNVCITSNVFYMTDSYIFAVLDSLLPIDAHKRANKRLRIVLGGLNMTTYTISHWETREKLIQCVIASTHIPFVTSWYLLHPIYKSIDGGLIIDKSKYKNVISSPSFSIFEQFSVISFRRAIELFRSGKKIKDTYN
jgi:hypothetical protein